MKKILSICLAAAAFVGCTSTEVEFDTPQEIGFTAVADNSTRAVVDGDVYPTTLNMYVYAWTAGQTTVDYINNGLFVHRADKVGGKDVWGGNTPYYWPNVNRLHFAGYSASGNVANATVSYVPATDKLTIAGYTPGTATAAGANDLMYFPSTAADETTGYLGKDTESVPVVMYHTCSWITFLVKGEGVTTDAAAAYTVTEMSITAIDDQATVVCSSCEDTDDVATAVVWGGDSTPKDNENAKTATLDVTLATLGSLTTTAINVETGDEYKVADGGNLVVIPQIPGSLNLTYTYNSSTGASIEEKAENISLKLNDGNTQAWEPGKHYIYTITIKANEILVAPNAAPWVDGPNSNITVE